MEEKTMMKRSSPAKVRYDRGPHWRAQIGFILIANDGLIEEEMIRLALPGMGIHFTRLPGVVDCTVETLMAMEKGLVLRLAHREALVPMHRALKEETSKMGKLMTAIFVRLTPGRGARPEILFNLQVSGPPAVFFIYHVYPVVDLFGKVAWVEGGAQYEGLNEQGMYDSFTNTVNVGFADGGLGQWTWAGGIEISESEEYQRYILTGGTLIRQGGNWIKSTSSDIEEIKVSQEASTSLEDLFLDEVTRKSSSWQKDAETALEAIRLSLAAEQSVKENRRVIL